MVPSRSPGSNSAGPSACSSLSRWSRSTRGSSGVSRTNLTIWPSQAGGSDPALQRDLGGWRAWTMKNSWGRLPGKSASLEPPPDPDRQALSYCNITVQVYSSGCWSRGDNRGPIISKPNCCTGRRKLLSPTFPQRSPRGSLSRTPTAHFLAYLTHSMPMPIRSMPAARCQPTPSLRNAQAATPVSA